MLKSLGKKVYTTRLAKGLTQAELVRRTGIPQPNLSNLEKGKKDITLKTFFKLARALELTPAQLLEPFAKTQDKALTLTRSRVERLAKAAVHGGGLSVSPAERNIAKYLRTTVPMPGRKIPGKKEVYKAWFALKGVFTDAELKTCLERVRDEIARSRWTKNS